MLITQLENTMTKHTFINKEVSHDISCLTELEMQTHGPIPYEELASWHTDMPNLVLETIERNAKIMLDKLMSTYNEAYAGELFNGEDETEVTINITPKNFIITMDASCDGQYYWTKYDITIELLDDWDVVGDDYVDVSQGEVQHDIAAYLLKAFDYEAFQELCSEAAYDHVDMMNWADEELEEETA